MKTSTKTESRLLALAISFAVFVGGWAFCFAGPYSATLKDHGHTGPGDGGALVNPSITGGSSTFTRVGAGAVYGITGDLEFYPFSNTSIFSQMTFNDGFGNIAFVGRPAGSPWELGSLTFPWTWVDLSSGVRVNGTAGGVLISTTITAGGGNSCGAANIRTNNFFQYTPKSTASRIHITFNGRGSVGAGGFALTLSRGGGFGVVPTDALFTITAGGAMSNSTFTWSGSVWDRPLISSGPVTYSPQVGNGGVGSPCVNGTDVATIINVEEYSN